jgi:hypothetical protein
MTLSAAERAAISRQNGQKSKGPKSAQGKSHSRFNALKHGLKAKLPVLPGEDAQEYQGRLDAWIADWQPTHEVEQSLVERAVTLTWQLDRAERAETARLTAIIRSAPAEAALRQEEEALTLGRRLFFDPRGPVPLYPHSLYPFPDRPRISSSGLSDDPDDPPRLLLRLESTAAGCRWLLDRWAELGALLDRGLGWQSPDKLRAIRLLGRQPLEAADSELVATILQACHVLDLRTHHQARAAMGEAADQHTLQALGPGAVARQRGAPGSHNAAASEPGPVPDDDRDESDDGEMGYGDDAEDRITWQRCGAAFTELLGELTKEEARAYRRRLEGRQVDRLRPKDPVAARATLRAIVEKATTRLEAKLEVHEARAALEAAEAVDRLCFDDSPEGERLRRFQLASQRALLRTVDSLLKLRRQEPPRQTESDPAEPAGTGPTVAGPSATICCGPDGIHSSSGADLSPAVPAPPRGRPSRRSRSRPRKSRRTNPPPREPTHRARPRNLAQRWASPGFRRTNPATRHSQAATARRGKPPPRRERRPMSGPMRRPHRPEAPLVMTPCPQPRRDSPRPAQDHAPGWTNTISPAARSASETPGLEPRIPAGPRDCRHETGPSWGLRPSGWTPATPAPQRGQGQVAGVEAGVSRRAPSSAGAGGIAPESARFPPDRLRSAKIFSPGCALSPPSARFHPMVTRVRGPEEANHEPLSVLHGTAADAPRHLPFGGSVRSSGTGI